MFSGTDKTEADEGSGCPWAREVGYGDFRPIDDKVKSQVGTGQGPGGKFALSDAAGAGDVDSKRCDVVAKLTTARTCSAYRVAARRGGGSVCHQSDDRGD
jgi:hypothetical protein